MGGRGKRGEASPYCWCGTVSTPQPRRSNTWEPPTARLRRPCLTVCRMAQPRNFVCVRESASARPSLLNADCVSNGSSAVTDMAKFAGAATAFAAAN
jgi:hypothetical protein